MYMEDIELLLPGAEKGSTTWFTPDARFIHTGADSSGDRRTPVVNIYRDSCIFTGSTMVACSCADATLYYASGESLRQQSSWAYDRKPGIVQTYEEAFRVL